MSIVLISLSEAHHTQAQLDALVTRVGDLYAASLGCLPSQVRVLVEHRSGMDAPDFPNVEFLVPDGTPLAEERTGVEDLKRQIEHLLSMWPQATEMLDALNQRSKRNNNIKHNVFITGRNAT